MIFFLQRGSSLPSMGCVAGRRRINITVTIPSDGSSRPRGLNFILSTNNKQYKVFSSRITQTDLQLGKISFAAVKTSGN